MWPGITSRFYHTTFSNHNSLWWFLCFDRFSNLSSFLMTFVIFRNTDWIFTRIPSIEVGRRFSHTNTMGYGVWVRRQKRRSAILLTSYQGYTLLKCFTTVDVNLDQLSEGVFVRFLYYQVTPPLYTTLLKKKSLCPAHTLELYSTFMECNSSSLEIFICCLIYLANHLFMSVQFSHSVVSDSLWPHGQQHARLPCPSPTTRACSNSCPLSWWCHLTISSFIISFSTYLKSFPASGSFPMSQFFASDCQVIGVSASASVLPMNIQGWFPLGLTGLMFLQFKGLFPNNIVQKYQFFGA